MNKLFKDDIIEALSDLSMYIDGGNQQFVREELDGCEKYFPMVCYEHTDDSNFEVDINDSKFLTDPEHDGFWIVGYDDLYVNFLVCLKDHNSTLEIDCIEVNEDLRRFGKGGNIVSIIESVAADYYDDIIVSPFDTNAINFWNHMEYEEGGNGYWRKKL